MPKTHIQKVSIKWMIIDLRNRKTWPKVGGTYYLLYEVPAGKRYIDTVFNMGREYNWPDTANFVKQPGIAKVIAWAKIELPKIKKQKRTK